MPQRQEELGTPILDARKEGPPMIKFYQAKRNPARLREEKTFSYEKNRLDIFMPKKVTTRQRCKFHNAEKAGKCSSDKHRDKAPGTEHSSF